MDRVPDGRSENRLESRRARQGTCTERRAFARVLPAVAGALALAWSAQPLAQSPYGRPGEPVNLTVGYQPYFAEAWSGAVVRALKLHEKYLPEGSVVHFKVGLKGPVLVSALRTGEQAIGYLGLAPTVTAIQETQFADLRAVAVAGMSGDQCNVVLARLDAPELADARAAMAWLAGKRVAVPSGSCADLFLLQLVGQGSFRPGSVIDYNVDAMPASWRGGGLDAAIVWEPMASRLEEAHFARRILTGTDVNRRSASFIVMRADFIRARPDIVAAWLAAEREAQNFMADPRNVERVVQLIRSQTVGISETVIRRALVAQPPSARSGSRNGATLRTQYPFAFTPEVVSVLRDATRLMGDRARIAARELRPDAIYRAPLQHSTSNPTPNTHIVEAQVR